MAASCGPISDTALPWVSWAQLPFSVRSRDQRIPRQIEHKSNLDIRKSVPSRQILLSRPRQTREFAEAFHFAAGGHSAVLLHHGAHLQVLLEDRVNVLNCCAAALGDALTALAVNNVMVAALFVGHRIDDGLHLLEFFLIHLRNFGKFGVLAYFLAHVHNLLERAHLAYLLQLIAKIFKREFFLAQFAFD